MRKQLWGRQSEKKRRRRARFIAFLLIFLGILALIQIQVQPVVETIAAQRAHLEVINIINAAVDEQLGQGIGYQQLVNVVTDEQGMVSYIQPDTVKITRLTTAIALDIEERINDLEEQGIEFPIGLLTGYILLADKGPNFHIDIRPTGDVAVDISDEFEEAGINQTRHRVILNVEADLGILIPFQSELVRVTNSLPLAENIIVGPIPDTYLNFNQEDVQDLPQGFSLEEGEETPASDGITQ